MDDPMQQPIREPQAEIRELQPDAIHDARTAWLEAPQSRASFLAMVLVPGIIFAVLGPFGSFGAPLWARLAYWVPTMASGALIGASLRPLLARVRPLRSRPLLTLTTFATVITLAMTLIAWGAGNIVFGSGAIRLNLTFAFYVWLVSMLMMGVGFVVYARKQRVATAASPAPSTKAPLPASLGSRLPPRLRRAAIQALQAEDHYVRVHTDAGSDLILMRISDAVAEMGSTPGARTHRSWWVSRSAVQTVSRRDGRLVVILVSGLEVPVSRGYASELRDAGWLTGSLAATTLAP